MSDEDRTLDSLLGAYALDALEDDEQIAVEQHLASSPAAKAEADRYLMAVQALAETTATVELPSGGWDAIAARLAEPSAVLPVLRLPAPPPGAVLPLRGRPRRTLTAVAVAAAAAAFVAGVVVARPRHDSSSSAARLRAAATSALTRPGAHVGTLVGTTPGTPTVRAVVDPDGNGYLFADTLPALATGRTYQLWTLDSGTPVSLGVIGARPTVVAFPAGTQPHTLAITDEAAPGAPAPSGTPLVSGAVS